MSRKPEITWSLMHPTPLDVDYMKLVVKKAAEYRVDSFEICADCHTNLGGMDGLTDYADFPVTHKSIDLAGIEANRKKLREVLAVAHSIRTQDFGSHAIVAFVSLESQAEVGIHRVHSFFLQFVGAHLVHQSDAASLLLQIYDYPFSFLLDHLHGLVQLGATVTACRAQDVPRGA